MDVAPEMTMLNNMLGPLTPVDRVGLQALVDNPTLDGWDTWAHKIIKTKPTLTLWQAVCIVDPTFPRKGRIEDVNGNLLHNWARIPTTQVLVEALRYAAYLAEPCV